MQNVGAYGVEVSEFIASVRTWDRETGNFKTFATPICVRLSRFNSEANMVNGSPRYVVLTVDFQFTLGSLSSPIKYGELAKSLGVQVGGARRNPHWCGIRCWRCVPLRGWCWMP